MAKTVVVLGARSSSRTAMPGKGLWAAGAFATRALVQAAAQELREDGIHAALLVVDATIESPKTAEFTRDAPSDSLAVGGAHTPSDVDSAPPPGTGVGSCSRSEDS